MLPAVRRGAERSGRSLDTFRVCMKPLVASARTDELLERKIRDARARIAFYASTPGYVAAFEHLGLGDLAGEAKVLSRAQRWEELPTMISDETLEQFVVIGTYNEIGKRLLDRFGSLVTDIEFSIAVEDDDDRATLADLARMIQSSDDDEARRAISSHASS
jgi:alkanesulfonate monooxygenase SsuD/methylene tetrahydromethanopterin reductase-like flavin-dependent oxidoreductase (luciferase family)